MQRTSRRTMGLVICEERRRAIDAAKPTWRSWSAAEIVPRRRAVLRLLGVPADAGDRLGDIDGPYEAAMARFLELARPRAGFTEVAPADAADRLFAGHSEGSSLRRRLQAASVAALFVATVGPGPEAEAARLLTVGEYLQGTLLDSVASEATECLVERLQSDVTLRLGVGSTLRFSPGYGGWGLEAQSPLLLAVEAFDHDVRLTSSSMMLPRKTVSGVIVPRRQTDSTDPCDFCDNDGCAGRGPCGSEP